MTEQRKIKTGDYVEIKIGANPEFLTITRSVTKQMSQMIGFDEKNADSITLAVEEALTNVIRHGYGGPCEKTIILRINRMTLENCGNKGIEIEIRDFGKQVDPESIQGRDLNDVRPGGLGVHIIKSTMDDVEYSPMQEGGMQLKMCKYIVQE